MRTAATLLISTTLAIAHATPARADLITVLAADELIVNHNDVFIAGFTSVLTTAPTTPGSILYNSMRFAFEPSGGNVTALVSGNDLPIYPPEPFQTIALCVDGGLNQLGATLTASSHWMPPDFDLDGGVVSPAVLVGFNHSGQIDITIIPDGGSGYVGYATSDLTKFGYMQIQRLSLYEWRLVGYRYDDSGAPVLVENLIPAPATLAALTLAALATRRRPIGGAR